MAEFNKPKHGEICWRELTTHNLETAAGFYRDLFGWKIEQSRLSPMEYQEIHADDRAVGGMMQINEGWGEDWQKIPAAWTSYVAVDDIAESIEKIKKFGGSICIEPFDAPGVGKLAYILDPRGIHFSIVQFL